MKLPQLAQWKCLNLHNENASTCTMKMPQLADIQ